MYDDYGLKKDFINKMMDTKINKTFERAATNMFNAAERLEKTYEKDLCDFNITQIIALYKVQLTSSLEYLLNMNSVFKRYTYYCIDINRVKDGINHYEEVTTELANSCLCKILVDDKIVTREQLLSTINKLINPSDKFLLLATFEGLATGGHADMCNLELTQFKKNKVHLESGRVLSVSKELCNLAIESSEEYFYYSTLGLSDKAYPFKKDDTRVMKRLYNTVNDSLINYRRVAYSKYARINTLFDSKAYTYGHLIESGRIDLIKRTMKDKDIPDPRKAMAACKEELALRYGEIQAVGRFLTKYGKYLEQ